MQPLMSYPKSLTAALSLLVTLTAAAAPDAPAAEPVRLSTRALDQKVHVEVRDLLEADAEAAARAAVEEILAIEEQVAPGALGARAGTGRAVAVDASLLSLLERAQSFCLWSDGALGPLGGRLYELWEKPGPVPGPEALAAALPTTFCRNLRLDREAGQATSIAGGRLDLRHFALGWAADRAAQALREQGVANGYVEIGPVRLGFGTGPSGRGWRVLLPVFSGLEEPLGEIWLQDQALAIAGFRDRPLEAGGREHLPYLDLRTGQPQDGVIAVLAVTELAVDAQALAASLYLLGVREGQYRAGQLRPAPAVRWLLGSGEGPPLINDFNWSRLRTR